MTARVVRARGAQPHATSTPSRSRIVRSWSSLTGPQVVKLRELPKDMLEDDFQAVVLTAALHHGWMAVHFRRALQKSARYSTPVQGMKGSPDLTLARDGVVLLAELKTNTGTLRPEQRQWREHLGDAWREWRPRNWAGILFELETGEPPRKEGTA